MKISIKFYFIIFSFSGINFSFGQTTDELSATLQKLTKENKVLESQITEKKAKLASLKSDTLNIKKIKEQILIINKTINDRNLALQALTSTSTPEELNQQEYLKNQLTESIDLLKGQIEQANQKIASDNERYQNLVSDTANLGLTCRNLIDTSKYYFLKLRQEEQKNILVSSSDNKDMKTQALNIELEDSIILRFNKAAQPVFDNIKFDSVALKKIIKIREDLIATGVIDQNKLLSEKSALLYGQLIKEVNNVFNNPANSVTAKATADKIKNFKNDNTIKLSAAQQAELERLYNASMNYCAVNNNCYNQFLQQGKENFKFAKIHVKENKDLLTQMLSNNEIKNYSYLVGKIKQLLDWAGSQNILSNPLQLCQ